jgi:hypothetical protein
MKVISFNVYGDLIGMVALLSEVNTPYSIECSDLAANNPNFQAGTRRRHKLPPNLPQPARRRNKDVLLLPQSKPPLTKDQPFQFKLCGIIQLCLDSFVVLQIGYFKWREGLTEINEEIDLPEQPAKEQAAGKDL